MQSSKVMEDFKNQLSLVESLTDDISEFLNKDWQKDTDNIEKLNRLYRIRKKEVINLKSLIEKINSKLNESLKKRVADLVEKDKDNIDKINRKFDEVKSNLRNLNNKKSLLLYR